MHIFILVDPIVSCTTWCLKLFRRRKWQANDRGRNNPADTSREPDQDRIPSRYKSRQCGSEGATAQNGSTSGTDKVSPWMLVMLVIDATFEASAETTIPSEDAPQGGDAPG